MTTVKAKDAMDVGEVGSLESRRALIGRAALILLEVVRSGANGSFRAEETALGTALAETGLEVTRRLLEGHVEPQPDEVLIDGERYRLVRARGSSCRVCTPFGVLSIPRQLYSRTGSQEGDVARIGLLEKRAGIIHGTTPRLAELITYYDAITPSREGEKLMDLAGLAGPRRAALEKKAGAIGSDLSSKADDLLERARREQPLPKGAAMITIGMDRVNVPYEEPNIGGQKSERTVRLREKKKYQRKEPDPVIRAFRGDFIGSVHIRDKHGELLENFAYGLPHTDDPHRIANWLAAEVVEAVRKDTGLLVNVCQDGARELWPLMWEALAARPELKGTRISACVDFHHFSPRARSVVELLWGKDAYPEWERRLLDEKDGVLALSDAVLQECDRLDEKIATEQLEAAHALLTYIEERTRADGREDRRSELFDYAGLRALGLPIGSGPTEATVKSLASVRMKRSGDRWSVEGARATLTCRALTLSSGRWERVWPRFADAHLAEVVPLAA
jgi:hypothetical protein